MREPFFPASTDGNDRLVTAGLLTLGLLVCGVAISCQSYWLDEAGTAYNASMPTLADWWRTLKAERNSNLQMPFYQLFAWGWAKLAGVNEFALRAGNALWFVPGLLALAAALRRETRLRGGISLVLLSSPFVWYYLNEARPYAMQIGASLVVFAALYRLSLNEDPPASQRRWVTGLCLASFVLAASGMLAMLWLGAYFGAAILSASKERLRGLAREYRVWWATTLILLLAVGLFYLWTLRFGARASAVGRTDIRNVFFIPFEIFGFSGLGPGRVEIRTAGLRAFWPWLPPLALYGVMSALMSAAGWVPLRTFISRRALVCWTLAFAIVAGFILAVGVAVRFRVLGRHCAPMLPIALLAPAMGVAVLLRRRDAWARLAVGGFVGLSMVSCLLLRFNERHAKDDYRAAAAVGREALARGEVVWWNADEQGALVYHVPLAEAPGAPNAAMLLANPGKGFEQNLVRPGLVLTSKPDVYDGSGALADYLAREGFERVISLTAFTAWRRPVK